jgi:hypothetical protein
MQARLDRIFTLCCRLTKGYVIKLASFILESPNCIALLPKETGLKITVDQLFSPFITFVPIIWIGNWEMYSEPTYHVSLIRLFQTNHLYLKRRLEKRPLLRSKAQSINKLFVVSYTILNFVELKELVSIIFVVPFFVSCSRDPNGGNNPLGVPDGTFQYKVNGNLVTISNISISNGEFTVFFKQLKGPAIPHTRYMFNGQKGGNHIWVFGIVSDSLALGN